jgi:hypothetical protein
VNPYAKIAIKIGVVIVICLILLVAYNMVGHKAFTGAAASFKREIDDQNRITTRLDSLLQYKDLLDRIRFVQLRDMETVRVLIPPKDEFVLTSYLRQVHGLLSQNHLETDGIVIGGSKPAVGGTTFKETWESDVTALQGELSKITDALQMFRDNMDQMNNLLVSFQFYEAMSTGNEDFAAIVGGIEAHTFTLTVRGSYADIKKFTYDVFNMRPHTALVNFQMAPQGAGMGPTRLYQASFTLFTYGDANAPPPLWLAYHQRGEKQENPEGAVPTGQGQEAASPAPSPGLPAGGEAGAPVKPPEAPESGHRGGPEALVGGKPGSGEGDR